jgi:PAS domain S-box-containing protein
MNSAINAIINADSEGKITFWNKRAEQIFGWKAEEITGKTLAETIIPEIHKKAHEEGMKNYMETGWLVLNEQLELSAIRKSGEEFPIEISIIPIEQDGKKFFLFFLFRISQKEKEPKKI